jgi:hypothetical protein
MWFIFVQRYIQIIKHNHKAKLIKAQWSDRHALPHGGF